MRYSEEYMDRHYKRAKCKVCGKTFWKRKKAHTSLRSKANIRPANAVTCCRKCSKKYEINQRKKYKVLYNENKKKERLYNHRHTKF